MAPGPRLRRRSLEHHRFQVPPEEEHDDSESSGSEYSEEHWRDLSELVRAALRDGLRQPDEHAADACISCTHATHAADLHPALDGGGGQRSRSAPGVADSFHALDLSGAKVKLPKVHIDDWHTRRVKLVDSPRVIPPYRKEVLSPRDDDLPGVVIFAGPASGAREDVADVRDGDSTQPVPSGAGSKAKADFATSTERSPECVAAVASSWLEAAANDLRDLDLTPPAMRMDTSEESKHRVVGSSSATSFENESRPRSVISPWLLRAGGWRCMLAVLLLACSAVALSSWHATEVTSSTTSQCVPDLEDWARQQGEMDVVQVRLQQLHRVAMSMDAAAAARASATFCAMSTHDRAEDCLVKEMSFGTLF